jgi:hypothetical protein
MFLVLRSQIQCYYKASFEVNEARTSRKLSSVLSILPEIGSLCKDAEHSGMHTLAGNAYLASENTPIKPEITADFEKTQVRWDLLTECNLHQISRDELGCRNTDLHAVAESSDRGREHVLDGRHDLRCAEVLPCVEDGLDSDDDEQDDREREVGGLRVWLTERFPAHLDK